MRLRARRQAAQTAYTFLKDGDTETASITYRELDRRARAVATYLQASRLHGERALLLYPTGISFIVALVACWYAGVVAVPAYLPGNRRQLPKLHAISFDAKAAVVLTTAASAAELRSAAEETGALAGLSLVATDALEEESAREWYRPEIGSDSLAILQYTSGSTGSPKGVMVSHGNILSNQEMIRLATGHTEQDVVVGWLPLFHDMDSSATCCSRCTWVSRAC